MNRLSRSALPLAVLLNLSSASPAFAVSQERPPILLGQGEQRLLRIAGLTRYSLGSDAVRVHALPGNVEPGPDSGRREAQESLLLKGVHPGNSDLWVWKSDGSTEHRQIRVEAVAEGALPPALEKALSQLEEAEILYTGLGVVLRGEIQSLLECARIASITEAYPKDVRDETEVSEALLNQAAARLGEWLRKSTYSNQLRIERQDRNLWVRGALERPTERSAVERQIRAIYPRAYLELESLPDASPTIHFKVYLLELRRNKFGSLGLSWPGTQEGAFQVTTSGITDALQLNLALQALEGDGSARVLSNPELVVRAPGEAELFAGGELPIQIQAHFYSNVEWKQYGLTLHLKVEQSAGDRVRLDIMTEVSRLDPTISGGNIPGIQANRMKTQVDARYGLPLLLSGLLQDGMREQARGLPLLRQIPVLGQLFGSEDYLNERSELVAILLPSAAPPPAPMDRIERYTPKGPLPAPRNWVTPEQERGLRTAPDFPWNALK